MNALMNMMVGPSEGSEKTPLLRHGENTGKQKNEISEEGIDTGAGIGTPFPQILKHIVAGSGKSSLKKSERQSLSCTERSDADNENDSQNLVSAGTGKRHISHGVGKSKSHGTEIFNTDGSDKNTNKNTQGTVNTTAFSKNGIQNKNEEEKNIVLQYNGQENLKEGLNLQPSTNHQQNGVNEKAGGKTGVHLINVNSETDNNAATAQIAKTKSGDEKDAAAVRPALQERKASGYREALQNNSKKDNPEASVINLSDNEEIAVVGKQNTNIHNKARHVLSAAVHAQKQAGATGHASAGENTSENMAEIPATQKITEMYNRNSQRNKVGESEIGRIIDDQSKGQQKQGTETAQGKMKQQFMVRENARQGENNARGAGEFDGLNSNEQQMKEFPREVNITDRASEGKHFAANRIEAQSMVTVKNQEHANIKSQDIINQVATAVQTKLGKGFGRVKIELNPPHLGSIDLDLIVRDNKVHVMLRADQYDVRQLLQSNSDVLKTALNTQGLVAETIDVSLHDRMGGNGFQFDRDGRLFDNRQDKRHGGRREGDEESSPDGISAVEYTQNTSAQTDGQISLFA